MDFCGKEFCRDYYPASKILENGGGRLSKRISIQEKWRQRVSNRRSISMSTKMQDSSMKDMIKIRSFLDKKDVAPWFRGTSIFHVQGSKRLFNALRDDTEQSTSHRVRACLNLIGLQPMVTSKDIKVLMRLSRGNDLAFLWFLMELHYKTPKPGYSVNEQLLCTAIFHLDKVTTLRELDRILPKPLQDKKREQSTISTQRSPPSRKPPTPGRKRKGNKYILPYFCKQTVPKPYGKPMTLTMPDFKVTFDVSTVCNDVNYEVPNETNRWYANYKFQTPERIAYRVIKDEIENIFNNFEGSNLKASTLQSICEHHKNLKEIENKFELEMRVKVRDTCLKHYFGDGEQDQQRLERIRKMLDKEIDLQLEKFHKEVVNVRKSMTLKTLTSQTDLISIIMGNENKEDCEKKLKTTNITNNSDTRNSKSVEGAVNVIQKSQLASKHAALGGTTNRNSSKVRTSLENGSEMMYRDSTVSGEHLQKVEKLLKNITPPADDVHSKSSHHDEVMDMSRPSQIYFHRAKDHQPYSFDYHKIFDFEHGKDYPTRVKAAALEALDKKIDHLTHADLMAVDYNEAVGECARNTWRNQLHNYMDLYGDRLQLKTNDNEENLYHKYPPGVYYNPKDTELMGRMLKDAFEFMRKNPKFVWAQLPEAHKVPLVKEWIAARYGKVYTTKDRYRSFAFSLKIFQALDKMIVNEPIPEQKELCNKTFVDYKCSNYLKKKVQYMKDEFNRKICEKIMEKSRVFWFAMRGYICSGGPPRTTYFAYMPSRVQDIQRFRLWRSDEFRNYKAAWDKRRAKQLREAH